MASLVVNAGEGIWTPEWTNQPGPEPGAVDRLATILCKAEHVKNISTEVIDTLF